MNLFQEFELLVRQMEDQKIQYAVVGAVALAFHAEPRFTQDIDVLMEDSDFLKIKGILESHGYMESAQPWTFQSTPLTLRRFIKVEGNDQLILDILLAGNSRHVEIIRNALEAHGEGGIIRVARKDDLIWLKKQRFSLQDQADIERMLHENS